jgi:RNA 2',3'-cyclic 3'-phosphodiesterase
MGTMRIFLAVFPSAAAQEAAADVIERLRRPDDGVSWVKRENLHYTLRFMGDLGESGLERVTLAARRAVVGHRRFEAALGSAGAFPKARRARVLWLGLSEGAEALAAVAQAVEHALRGHGFDRADRAFTSHLTLGRVRARDQDWSERLAGLSADPSPFAVDRVSVVQSTLSPKGSIYQVRAEAMLEP